MLGYSVFLFAAAFAATAMATATKLPPVTVTVTVACDSTPEPTVDLGYGLYAATSNDTVYPYYSFTNIRYAEPPVGDLRFRPPVPPKGDNRTVHDGKTGASCMQGNPAWFLEIAGTLVLPAFISGENVSSVVEKAAGSASSGTAETPKLSDIPAQDPNTSEDCLFLDVFVPKAIYDSPRRTAMKGKGGGMYFPLH